MKIYTNANESEWLKMMADMETEDERAFTQLAKGLETGPLSPPLVSEASNPPATGPEVAALWAGSGAVSEWWSALDSDQAWIEENSREQWSEDEGQDNPQEFK